jgi:hypothetical protein
MDDRKQSQNGVYRDGVARSYLDDGEACSSFAI